MSLPLFEVHGLTKRYLGVAAVDDLSFDVRSGDVLGLIGPNGSGKSTSIDCISGFQPADAGTWSLQRQALSGLSPHRIARLGMTRTFQTVRAYDQLSLLNNLQVASQQSDGAGWLQALVRSRAVRRNEKSAEARARVLLASIGLTQYADAPAAVLSYGQRKLLAIAASMMSKPHLVIFDEPVAGVNPTMVRHIEAVIRKLNAEGVTFIIVEHNVEFILNLCNRVVVLEAGRKIAEGAPELIRSDSRVLAAYLGKAGAEARQPALG